MVQEINRNLKSILSLYLPDADFTLRTNRPYLKYPEDKEIIFKIKNKYECYISNFIKNFNLTWDYTAAKAYEIDLKESYMNEEAVWNRSVHSKEIFLIPQVS